MCPKITMQKGRRCFSKTAGNSCLFLSESYVKEKMKLKCQSNIHVVEGRDESYFVYCQYQIIAFSNLC